MYKNIFFLVFINDFSKPSFILSYFIWIKQKLWNSFFFVRLKKKFYLKYKIHNYWTNKTFF
jgi:hypothetical protein